MAQTFSDFELILVDDGSPDNSGKICDEYAEKDSRIKVIHQQNAGQSVARNVALDWMYENSNSEYIAFIDSDDWIHPRYLEILYNSIIETGSQMSICNYQKTSGETEEIQKINTESKIVTAEYIWQNHRIFAATVWAQLLKAEIMKDLRFPAGLIHEDEYIVFKIFFCCNRISFVDLPLYYYFENTEGTMLSKWSIKHMDAINAFYEQYLFFKEKGYNDFAKTALICCLRVQKRAVRSIKELCPNDKKLFKDTRKRFRRMLKEYADEIDLKNSPDRKAFMKAAYPIESKVKKLFTIIFEKLLKR